MIHYKKKPLSRVHASAESNPALIWKKSGDAQLIAAHHGDDLPHLRFEFIAFDDQDLSKTPDATLHLMAWPPERWYSTLSKRCTVMHAYLILGGAHSDMLFSSTCLLEGNTYSPLFFLYFHVTS